MNYDRLGCCKESFKIPLAGNQSIQIFLYYLQCHTSKILAVERNPFYPKYFLTIGGYTSKVRHISQDCFFLFCADNGHSPYKQIYSI